MTTLQLTDLWTPVGTEMHRRNRDPILTPYHTWNVQDGVLPVGALDVAANGSLVRNVGSRKPTSGMTVVNGDLTVANDTTYSNVWVKGRIIGRGNSNTLVQDFQCDGPTTAPYANDSALRATSLNFAGVVFRYGTIKPVSNQGFTDAIDGGGYTAEYMDMYDGVDGFGANAVGSASLRNSRISRGYYDSWWSTGVDGTAVGVRTASYVDNGGRTHTGPFPAQSSGDTHSDGAQIQQFSGWYLGGNYFGGARTVTSAGVHLDPYVSADYTKIMAMRAALDYVNSAMIFSSASASAKVGGIIEYNWLHGGQARFNMAYKTYDDMSGWTIRNNRVIRTSYGYDFYIQNLANPTMSGNVYDDDNTAVTVTRWG